MLEACFDKERCFVDVSLYHVAPSSGFVGYSYPESAEEAFVNLNGTKVENKVIKIDFPGRKMPVSRLIVKNLPTVKRRMRKRKIDSQSD